MCGFGMLRRTGCPLRERPQRAVSYTASVKAVRLLCRLRSNKLPDRSQPAVRYDLETARKSYSVSYVFAKTIETLSKTLSRATLCWTQHFSIVRVRLCSALCNTTIFIPNNALIIMFKIKTHIIIIRVSGFRVPHSGNWWDGARSSGKAHSTAPRIQLDG